MDKKLVYLSANEQKLICPEPFQIASGTVEYVEAHFELGDNWDSFDSIKAVWWSDFKTVGTILDSQGVCQVPYEVVIRRSEVMVNLVGSVAENDVLVERLTTFPVLGGTVLCDARVGGDDPHPATPSQVEQFADRVRNDANRAETAASNAETSAQSASDSATSAHNSAESAHDDKIAIEEAIAEVIQQIEDFEQVQVVVNTLPPSSQATSDFTDGVLTLGIPQGVKGDTGNGIQSIAKTGTSGLVDTYRITYTDGQTTTFTVTNGAKGDTGNGIQSIAKTSTVGLVDTYTITYTNGTTTTFTVTNGEKGDKGDTGEVSLSELEDATIVQTLSDTEPYNYRRTNNGNGSGHREYDEIVGASVGWNQLVPTDKRDFTNSSTDSRALKFVFCKSASPYTQIYTENVTATGLICGIVSASFSGNAYFIHSGNERNINITGYDDIELQSGHKYYFSIRFTGIDPSTVGGLSSKDLMLADLTLFNSAIADYVYSLETATAGSGVTWLKTHFPKLFDNGYMSFDSGSIKSVSGLTAHEMVGKNLFDKNLAVANSRFNTSGTTAASGTTRSDYIPCLPNTEYYAKSVHGSGTMSAVWWFDINKNFISYSAISGISPASGVTTSPSNAYYMGVNMPNASVNECCINLSDTSINGQYFPHEHHSYPLDSSVELRGQYRLDANNQLYADGDVYKASGEIGRTWSEEVDLGSLAWATNHDGTNGFEVYRSMSGMKSGSDVISNKLEVETAWEDTAKYSIRVSGTTMLVKVPKSVASDVNAVKTWLTNNDVKAIYELATPTTETATPYDNPQWCDSHGTEEYVGSELPVGHNTDYPMTMVDCADGLGNGTYTPKLTVTNGKLTFEWQSV